MWDERYSSDGYAYGTEANDFLRQRAGDLPLGRVLCLGDGEGRNGVWLAQQGYAVTSVDTSSVGLAKARLLAAERGVSIETRQADLADFHLGDCAWSGIVSIFCHLAPDVRREMHRRVVAGLEPGGVFLLEAYTPRQLAFGTGGPPKAELMMDLVGLRSELAGLVLEHAAELEREVHEGDFHNGLGAVVQIVARKAAGASYADGRPG